MSLSWATCSFEHLKCSSTRRKKTDRDADQATKVWSGWLKTERAEGRKESVKIERKFKRFVTVWVSKRVAFLTSPALEFSNAVSPKCRLALVFWKNKQNWSRLSSSCRASSFVGSRWAYCYLVTQQKGQILPCFGLAMVLKPASFYFSLGQHGQGGPAVQKWLQWAWCHCHCQSTAVGRRRDLWPCLARSHGTPGTGRLWKTSRHGCSPACARVSTAEVTITTKNGVETAWSTLAEFTLAKSEDQVARLHTNWAET